MQGGRSYGVLKKPRLIIKNGVITKDMNLGDKGQVLVIATIEAERKQELADYREITFKTIRVRNMELLNSKPKEKRL